MPSHAESARMMRFRGFVGAQSYRRQSPRHAEAAVVPQNRDGSIGTTSGSCKIGLAAMDAAKSIGEQLNMHPLQSIGEQLNAARRKQGFSIDEIAEQTRIGKHYIAALEQNNFVVFPGEFYALSFLRQYADALQLASEDLVDALREEFAELRAKPKKRTQQPIGAGFHGLLGAARRKIRRWILEFVNRRSNAVVAGALMLVGVVGWWYVGQSRSVAVSAPADSADSEARLSAEPSPEVAASDAAEPPPTRSTTPGSPADSEARLSAEPSPEAAESDAAEPPPTRSTTPGSPSMAPSVEPASSTPTSTLAVELQASANVWVRVVVDGGSPREATLQAGNRRTLEALERVQFTAGDAGAITLVVNGQVQDAIGVSGQVRHIQVERNGWRALPAGSF